MTKSVSPQNKSKFIYTATEKTADMIPVIIEMVLFASKHNPAVAPEALLFQLAKNKARTIRIFSDRIKNNL